MTLQADKQNKQSQGEKKQMTYLVPSGGGTKGVAAPATHTH